MARRALMLREGRAPVWDRLLTMVFFAALLHGMVITGLTFSKGPKEQDSTPPGLEVLLVSDELPEADRNPQAAYLAQRTQLGSGNTKKPVKPHNRASAAPIPPHAGTPEGDTLTARGEAPGGPDDSVLTTTAWRTNVVFVADAGGAASARNRPLLIDTPAAPPGPTDEQGEAQLRGPNRDELWITPDTRAAALAPYLDAWRRKVERIGTLNFPTAARVTAAHGSPLVAVAIDSSGTVVLAEIRRSSGDPELDQAALGTLRLASPFDPFPPELAARYRVLHFAYEWQFTGGRAGSGTVSTTP